MILDMKDNIQAVNPKIGKQRVQYYDATKLGYVMCLTTIIELSYWKGFFQRQIEEILESEILIALFIAKINDRTGFKDNLSN